MSGVAITGEIVPLNGGNFPVFSAERGKGGYRTVSTIADRDALVSTHALFLEEGMLVYVHDTLSTYSLNSDLLTWSFFAGVGNVNVRVPQTAQGNIAATNLFPAVPRAAMWEINAYMSVTQGANNAPNGQIDITYRDQGGLTKTVPVFSSAYDMGSTGGTGGQITIETDGASMPQYSTSGVVSQGPLVFGIRIAATVRSDLP